MDPTPASRHPSRNVRVGSARIERMSGKSFMLHLPMNTILTDKQFSHRVRAVP